MEKKELGRSSVKEKKYITFTELVEMRRESFLDMLIEEKIVYILSDKIPPIKISLAEFQ